MNTLNTGPNMKYGYATAGKSMRYASRKKTLLDAALAIRRGNQIVAWHAPGNTQTDRDVNISRLQSALRLTLATQRTETRW
ncbi:MAG: hypothetical protein QOJ99_4690 [Bryobacterales bacterium]|jgi:hypothetical protein|nr:hypothetical protein [Bryobacterales bacterium]